LRSCYVFNADILNEQSIENVSSEIVGIYKNGRIIWHSKNMINIGMSKMFAEWIWVIKDVNNDGKVEILTTWSSSSGGYYPSGGGVDPPVYLWIFSWDGLQGVIINECNDEGQSVIQTTSRGMFYLVDVEGDGVWEIQSDNYPETQSDSLNLKKDSVFLLRTYSWNGQFYGRWPNTPQTDEDYSYPRNKLNINIKSRIEQIEDSLYYRYSIENLSSSHQAINEFVLEIATDSLRSRISRNCWVCFQRMPSVECINSYVGNNYIDPGEKDTSFYLSTSLKIIPQISKIYCKGDNGHTGDTETIYENSYQGYTISPENPPFPFIPNAFLDTLMTYPIRSFNIGWINNQSTAEKYMSYFNIVKTQLQQNNINGSRSSLQNVLRDVKADSGTLLSSETYALLRYNTEYLLSQLPEPSRQL
jgi:hypothetical protein